MCKLVTNKHYDTEAECTKAIKKYLDAQPDVFYYKASERFIGGVSDIIACCNGHFIALELKSATGKPSKQQERFIEKVMFSGGYAAVCRSVEDVAELIHLARQRKW